jgi:hypothetical protein
MLHISKESRLNPDKILAKTSRYFGKGGEEKSKNCQMKDEGTWDCSTSLKECFGVHSRE